MDGLGRRTIDVLAHVDGVKLAAIFSPEHGVTGALDTTAVGNTVDAATGVPVYSVYGDTDAKRRPPLDILKDLDAVVYDIQDAGARFYTYETTLGYLLEAAAKAGTEVVVLDRPEPDHRQLRAGTGVAARAGELRQLHAGAGAARHDGRRAGEDVQRRAPHQRAADGDCRWKAGFAATGSTPPDWCG